MKRKKKSGKSLPKKKQLFLMKWFLLGIFFVILGIFLRGFSISFFSEENYLLYVLLEDLGFPFIILGTFILLMIFMTNWKNKYDRLR